MYHSRSVPRFLESAYKQKTELLWLPPWQYQWYSFITHHQVPEARLQTIVSIHSIHLCTLCSSISYHKGLAEGSHYRWIESCVRGTSQINLLSTVSFLWLPFIGDTCICMYTHRHMNTQISFLSTKFSYTSFHTLHTHKHMHKTHTSTRRSASCQLKFLTLPFINCSHMNTCTHFSHHVRFLDFSSCTTHMNTCKQANTLYSTSSKDTTQKFTV